MKIRFLSLVLLSTLLFEANLCKASAEDIERAIGAEHTIALMKRIKTECGRRQDFGSPMIDQCYISHIEKALAIARAQDSAIETAFHMIYATNSGYIIQKVASTLISAHRKNPILFDIDLLRRALSAYEGMYRDNPAKSGHLAFIRSAKQDLREYLSY
jgi:hypothetical protein